MDQEYKELSSAFCEYSSSEHLPNRNAYYSIKHGATLEDLEKYKNHIFKVFYEIDSLMRQYLNTH